MKIDENEYPTLRWFDPNRRRDPKNEMQLAVSGTDWNPQLFLRTNTLWKALLVNQYLVFNKTRSLGDLATLFRRDDVDPKKVRNLKRHYLAGPVYDRVENDHKVRLKLMELAGAVPNETNILLFPRGGQFLYSILDPEESRVFFDREYLFPVPVPKGARLFLASLIIRDNFYGFETVILVGNERFLVPQHSIHHPGAVEGQFVTFVGVALLFMKYAEVETRIIGQTAPGGRKGVVNDQKYANLSSINVEIVDSRWFTTLIKTGALKVGWHFKLVPTGPREVPLKDRPRKLVYVKDYDKPNGYTRKAKVLGLDPEATLKPQPDVSEPAR